MVAWEGLAKQYGRRLLFSGLTGCLEPGRVLVVTGPNGSGKSTFLRILAGLVRPDAGTVKMDGITRQEIGFAAPDVAIYSELTGLENLEFFASVRGIDPKPAQAALERAGLRRAAGKPAGEYSSGMRQRLKLACAIIHDPALLLLDEPTLALDRSGVSFVENIIAEHAAAGKYIAVATNDPDEAQRWGADRIAMGG